MQFPASSWTSPRMNIPLLPWTHVPVFNHCHWKIYIYSLDLIGISHDPSCLLPVVLFQCTSEKKVWLFVSSSQVIGSHEEGFHFISSYEGWETLVLCLIICVMCSSCLISWTCSNILVFLTLRCAEVDTPLQISSHKCKWTYRKVCWCMMCPIQGLVVS